MERGETIPLPDHTCPWTGRAVKAPEGWHITFTGTAYRLAHKGTLCTPNCAPADVRDAFRAFMRSQGQ